MRNFKKVIAAGLALLMLALSVNVSFAAESYTEKEAVVVAKVNAAGIMQGTDKGFEPSKTLTRAEAAAIMVRMKGISESTVKQNTGATLFTDVAASHWAAGYINVASNYGIIKGVGANMFAPEKEVTVAEFYTMAIRALNAGQLVEAEGTWPTNYVNFAIENDLAEDVAQIHTATATRLTAATIVANTLVADMWVKSGYKSNGEVSFSPEGGTILKDILKISVKDGAHAITVKAVSNKDSEITDSADKDYKVVEKCDLSNVKVGLTYDAWLNKDGEILGLWISEDDELDSVEFTTVKKYDATNNKITLVVNGKDKEYEFHKSGDPAVVDATLYLNERLWTTTQTTPSQAAIAANTEYKDVRGTAYIVDGKLKSLYGQQYTNYGIVDEVSKTTVSFKTIKGNVGSSIYFADKDDEYFLTKDGKAFDYADLEEDDIVFWYEVPVNGNTKYVGYVSEDKVEGKVTAVDSAKTSYAKIDGTKYNYSASITTKGIDAKDEVILYLDVNGDIAMWESVSDDASDIAIVKQIRKVTGKYDETLEVILVDMNGNEMDAKEVNIKKSSEKLSVANTPEGVAAAMTKGSVICFELKEDKIIAKPFTVSDPEYTAINATGDWDTAGDIKYVFDKGNKYNTIKKATYVDGTDDTYATEYYVTDDTKVFKIRNYASTDDKFAYAVKVEEVKVSELDDMDIEGYVAGVDSDSKEIEYLVLSASTTVARTAETNFAFINKVYTGVYKDDKTTAIEVIFLDGTTESYFVTGDSTMYASYKATDFVDLSVSGEEVLEASLLNTTGTEDLLKDNASFNKYIDKKISNVRYEVNVAAYNSASDLFVADDCLVLELNDGKYTVSSMGDIAIYKIKADKDKAIADGKAKRIARVVTYQAKDTDLAEAKLIVFESDLKTE